MITAPYNFVPLNEKIFYPLWSEQVNHDIPFEDGESGEIDITITAKTPIFIRNHYQEGDEFYKNNDIKISKEFCHIKTLDGAKQFYIPGNSIKGMVRSVLEIMSFSKMKVDEDKLKKPLSIRDMTPTKYCLDTSIRAMKDCPNDMKKDLFEKTMVGTANGIGLLKINNDGSGTIEDYTIEDKNGFKTTYGIRTIKYDQLISLKYTEELRKKSFEEKYKTIQPYSTIKVNIVKQAMNRRYIGTFDNSGKEAILVLNSFIDGKDDGKKYEFVLCPLDKKSPIKIDKSIIDSFKVTYFSGDSELGNFWLEQSKSHNGQKFGIPVFLMKSNKGKVQAIGLTQLFKLAYTKTIFDAICQDNDKNKLDLAETIFGTEKDKLALKGRVQFSHLKCTTERYENQVDAILSSPNPTYYPNYIRQDGTNGKVSKYKTLMDTDAVISGWKRYPLHSQTMPSGESSDKEAVKIHFKPLESGTVFKGKLRFHNLKKAEIGALLSAITFHGQSDKCMHNIGMAKPLGYGKIDIKLIPRNLKYSQNEYLQEFEDEISKKIKDWKNSTQLKELFAMANINTKSNKDLQYQLLENPNPKYAKDKNDFTGAKKAKEFLLPHSGTITSEIKKTFTDSSDIKVQNQKSEPKNTGLKIVKKIETQNTNQTHQTNEIKEYSIDEIAKEVGVKSQKVLDFIQNSDLAISKKLNLNSTLKEAQAKNLIKEMKKVNS